MFLDLYFLNVGHGDCTVIAFPGRLTVVDINNAASLDPTTESEVDQFASTITTNYVMKQIEQGRPLLSLSELSREVKSLLMKSYEDLLTDPVEFLNVNFVGRDIHRFILTHPDMDHMSGIYRLRYQENRNIINLWDTGHQKTIEREELEISGYNPLDWEAYQALRASTLLTTRLELYRGAQGQYYVDDGIWILAPTPALAATANQNKDWNGLSYVLAIKYFDNYVILGGDATQAVWEDIYDTYEQFFRDSNISVLKASHHGRDSGYHQPSVAAMRPDYTIVSVGKLPDTDASNKYRHYSKVLTTRSTGSIHARLWWNGAIELQDLSGSSLI